MKMVYRYGAEKSNTIDRRLEEDEIDYELEGSDEERHLQDAEDAAAASCDICEGLVPEPNHMAGWSCMSEEGEMLGNSLGGVNGDLQNKGITSPRKCLDSGHDLRGYHCDEMVAFFSVNAADSDQCAIGTEVVNSKTWCCVEPVTFEEAFQAGAAKYLPECEENFDECVAAQYMDCAKSSFLESKSSGSFAKECNVDKKAVSKKTMKMVYRYGAEKSNTIDRRLEDDDEPIIVEDQELEPESQSWWSWMFGKGSGERLLTEFLGKNPAPLEAYIPVAKAVTRVLPTPLPPSWVQDLQDRHLQDAEDAAGSCDICQGLVPAPNHMAGWSCMSEEGEMLGNSLGGVNGDPQNKGITSPHKCTQSGHDLRGYLCDEMVASFRVNAADSDQCAIGTQMVSSQEWIPWTQVVVIKQNSKIVSC
jgi:hypothetical protein